MCYLMCLNERGFTALAEHLGEKNDRYIECLIKN